MRSFKSYEPFERGPYDFETREFAAGDVRRGRQFSCASWNPVGQAPGALILFSHFSGGSKTASSFLCEHLASHGYAVASLDHSDVILPRPSDAADPAERNARLRALIEARVPDIQFLLEVAGEAGQRVGIVGHSFGGWTALAAPSKMSRIEAVVALAPAGASNPRPGIIPATLDFAWGREVPTLVMAGDSDVSIPLDCVRDVFDRVPSFKRLVLLKGVDHLHFVDRAAEQHERVRAMVFPPELQWIQQEMRAFADLRPEAEAHRIVAGLTVAHFDATLKANPNAGDLLESYAASCSPPHRTAPPR
ncbi:MAG: alpha/beta hydrolase family protein [Candidatus Cybelea sp.]|jgi:predicted dienelactone hydrolase